MLTDEIEKMLFYREHIPVKVKLTKKVDDKLASELGIHKNEAGSEFELPWWQAEILVKHGIAELIDRELDGAYIRKKVWSEKAKNQLEEIEKDFYLKTTFHLAKLKKEYAKNPTPIVIQKIEDIELPLNDLLSSRVAKILKIAYRSKAPSIKEKLTIEENWLYERLREIITLWMEKLQKV